VIANRYGEDLLIREKIEDQERGDLRGKRVSAFHEGSGPNVRRVRPPAYRIADKSIVPNYDSSDKAVDLCRWQARRVFLWRNPRHLLQPLLDEDVAVLIPITATGSSASSRRNPLLLLHTIARALMHVPACDTVSVDALGHGCFRAGTFDLWDFESSLQSGHRGVLQSGRLGFTPRPASGAKDATTPLHPGALRFFTEAGIVKRPRKPRFRRHAIRKS